MTTDTILLICIAASIVILVCLLCYNSKSKKTPTRPPAAGPKDDPVAMGRITGTGVHKPGAAKTPEGKPTGAKPVEKNSGKEEKPVVVDPRSADERYAAARDLWICKYCETLNPYPPGMAPAKKPAATGARKSSLRGDLVGKGKKTGAVPGTTESRLYCIACGKQRL